MVLKYNTTLIDTETNSKRERARKTLFEWYITALRAHRPKQYIVKAT